MGIWKKSTAGMLSLSLLLGGYGTTYAASAADTTYKGALKSVESASVGTDGKNIVYINYNDGIKGKVTFLEDGIFRFNVDPKGEFSEYAQARSPEHVAKIQQYPDSSKQYSHPAVQVSDKDGSIRITSGTTEILLEKSTAKMTVKKDGKVVFSERTPLILQEDSTIQTLNASKDEYFYGGGTQNGRFSHKGEEIQIVNTNSWTSGGVASPNPFYWSTNGYGVLRNTFAEGKYNFEKANQNTVTTTHNENEFDAYYFLSSKENKTAQAQELLKDYYHVTGNPILLPEYGFYLGHLNCYNRDGWTANEQKDGGAWTIKEGSPADSKGKTSYEYGKANGYVLPGNVSAETLNGTGPVVSKDKFKPKDTDIQYSARSVIDRYKANDIPFGWFLPNDGYGCGYGQNGYEMTGGVNKDGTSSPERLKAIEENVKNLQAFTQYANASGINTGLWTQSDLTPDSNPETQWQKLRDFEQEVKTGGISTLKTDVAWVGEGYSFGLNGIKTAYDIVTKNALVRPNIVTLDGWAGTQRFGSIWTGDQAGGNWEYIRFHIPTYIGQSLSGNPNIGSDMDGIFAGAPIIATRDYQWKTFTPQMLDMDGWGRHVKSPFTHGDPYTGISRMYLKLKAQLMPYLYTTAASAANIDTGNGDTGLPMIRAMFLTDPENDIAYRTATQYQYMFGDDFLVAPVYQDTKADKAGNDVRNNIYLPGKDQIWIDYFTGQQYRGGQVLNNFDAPLWKLPLFVKNGAIIPMYEEHNNPEPITETNKDGLDKTKRIFEFYPAQDSSYTLFEDDGKSIQNNTTEDKAYGVIDNVSYNGQVKTQITSSVKDGTAILTAAKSEGTYKGYDANRSTKFVVNVSKKPSAVKAYNGDTDLEAKEVTSLEEFNKADENTTVWFFDKAPNLNQYGPKEEKFSSTAITTTPKVYVKLAKTDVSKNSQKVVVEGFENAAKLDADKLAEGMAVPANLTAPEEGKTPNQITLKWDAVPGATSYELMVDGTLFHIGAETTFQHIDLSYDSEHTYQVRSRNAEGYSAWSKEFKTKSLEDPLRNVPKGKVTWTGDLYGDHVAELAFDKDFQAGDGGFHSGGKAIGETLTVDYGMAHVLDKIEYYPRSDAGNGTPTKIKIETSLDGNHWTGKEYTWEKNAETKTVDLGGVAAQYVRFTPIETVGKFFSASEIAIYKKDGSASFAVGSNLMKETVSDNDLTNLKNYMGVSTVFDPNNFDGQVKAKYADLNQNDVYDVYDYAFTLAKLDGGTKKTGAVAGKVSLVPSAQTVKAGDTFTVELKVEDGKNINAFGALIPYDTSKFEFVADSIQKSDGAAGFENLSINKTKDNQGMVNLAFANRGDKALFNGTGVLASFQMKAKADGPALTSEDVMLVGPGFDFIKGTK